MAVADAPGSSVASRSLMALVSGSAAYASVPHTPATSRNRAKRPIGLTFINTSQRSYVAPPPHTSPPVGESGRLSPWHVRRRHSPPSGSELRRVFALKLKDND